MAHRIEEKLEKVNCPQCRIANNEAKKKASY